MEGQFYLTGGSGMFFLAPIAAVVIEISIPVGALATTLGVGISKGIFTAIKNKNKKEEQNHEK